MVIRFDFSKRRDALNLENLLGTISLICHLSAKTDTENLCRLWRAIWVGVMFVLVNSRE